MSSKLKICLILFLFICPSFASAAPIDDKEDSSLLDDLFGRDLEEPSDDPTQNPQELPPGFHEIRAARKALRDGDLELCRNKLRAAYAQAPNLPPTKLMLARLVLNAGQFPFGRRLLEEVAVSHPNHPELYLLFGRMALTDGHATDAALHFDRALSLPEPKNWNDGQRAYLKRACLEGQTDVAERRGDWGQAAKLYQERIDTRPKDAQLRDRFAMALFRAGDRDRAFEQFDLSRLQDENMNPPEVSMAVMLIREAEFDKADEWFAKALKNHPENAAVHFEHSIAMLYQDRTEEAAKSAQKAKELGMDSLILEMQIGLIAVQQGDSQTAQMQFEEVLKETPENAGALTKLALLLAERSDEDDEKRALALAEKAGKLYPTSPEVAAVLGWIYYRGGKQADGKNLLRAAASRPSADPLPLFLLGRMLHAEQETEETQQAAELLQKRLEQLGLFVFRPAARKWLKKVSP